MRRLALVLLTLLSVCRALADDDDRNILYIFHNHGVLDGVYTESITDIRHSHYDLDSVWHAYPVVQEVWTADTVLRYPLAELDSMTFVRPKTEYQPDVIRLDDRYRPHISEADGMTVTLSSNLPADLTPHIGDVLLYEGYDELFPDGFAGRVASTVDGAAGTTFVCDSVTMEDLFTRFVFYGEYDVEGQGTEASPMRVVHRAPQHRPAYENDGDILSGFWAPDSVNLGKIEASWKCKLSDEDPKVTLSVKGTAKPKMKIVISYSIIAEEPFLYVHLGPSLDTDIKATLAFGEKMDTTFVSVDCDKLGLVKDKNDNTLSITIVDDEVPIPEVPILSVGVKVGLFLEVKAEADMILSAEFKHHVAHTFTFNNGVFKKFEPQRSNSIDWGWDGELSGSMFAGVCGELSIGLPKKIAREKVSIYFGPAVEGKLHLDFKEGLQDGSSYSLIKDSKARTGLRVKGNVGLEAKVSKKKKWEWSQVELEPKHWLLESEGYLVPTFSDLTYKKRPDLQNAAMGLPVSDTLEVSATVSRDMFLRSDIGFRIYDEEGHVVQTKYQSVPLIIADQYCNPITETFTGLDFSKHLYTIAPISRLRYLEGLVQIPAMPRTVVTCPDSNHPHAIDLGLASGTKWSCCNLGANEPTENGDFYSFGDNTIKSKWLDFVPEKFNWRYGFVDVQNGEPYEGTHFSGTEFDMAHHWMGGDYQMPSVDQLCELGYACDNAFLFNRKNGQLVEYSDDNTEYAILLKGANGNDLVLPFTGHIEDAKKDRESTSFWAGSYYPMYQDYPFDAEPELNAVSFRALKNAGIRFINLSTRAEHIDPYNGCQVRAVSGPVWNAISFDHEELDFGNTHLGQPTEKTVIVTNNSSRKATLGIDIDCFTKKGDKYVIWSSLYGSPFTVNNDDKNFELEPGESRPIVVTCKPNVVLAPRKDIWGLKVSSDMIPAEFALVPLIHIPNEPKIRNLELSSKELQFGTITIGDSRTESVTFLNTGNMDLDVTFDAIDSKVFSSDICGKTISLKHGQTFTAAVTFTPQESGEVIATLTAQAEGLEGTAIVNLIGKGVTMDERTDFVDLGLPSGTLWATRNLGAQVEHDPGNYYAWGETKTKINYSWESYAHCKGTENSWTKYCNDSEWGSVDNLRTLERCDDAARAAIEGAFMPTREQFEELVNNTTAEWITDGHPGVRFTGRSGESIFLPAAGYMWERWLCDEGMCYYWSADKCTEKYAYYLQYDAKEVRTDWGWEACSGMPVRPVKKPALSVVNIDMGDMGQYLWMTKDTPLTNEYAVPATLTPTISYNDFDGYFEPIAEVRVFVEKDDGTLKELKDGESFTLPAYSDCKVWTSMRMVEKGEAHVNVHLLSDNPELNADIKLRGNCPYPGSDFTFDYSEPIMTFKPGESKTFWITNQVQGEGIFLYALEDNNVFKFDSPNAREISETLNGINCGGHQSIHYNPQDSKPHVTVLRIISYYNRFEPGIFNGNRTVILLQGE